MTSEDGVSRRDFLAASVLSAAAWPGDTLLYLPDRGEGGLASGVLAALFSDPNRAGVIGTACLRALPVIEASPDALARQIAADNFLGAGQCRSPAEVRGLLVGRIRRDFAKGEILSIDGWMLSATEARLYALAARCVDPAYSRR